MNEDIANTFKSFPILAILEKMTATETHSIIKSIQSITENKQPYINKTNHQIKQIIINTIHYPYYPSYLNYRFLLPSQLNILSQASVYHNPFQRMPCMYGRHVYPISDAISDIPVMHPPSIRRACISYQEFTGNMHTMEGRKDDTRQAAPWMYGESEP